MMLNENGSKIWFGWKLIKLNIGFHPNQLHEVANQMAEFMTEFNHAQVVLGDMGRGVGVLQGWI